MKKIPLLIVTIICTLCINAQATKFKILVVASQAKDHWKSISVGKEFFEQLGS